MMLHLVVLHSEATGPLLRVVALVALVFERIVPSLEDPVKSSMPFPLLLDEARQGGLEGAPAAEANRSAPVQRHVDEGLVPVVAGEPHQRVAVDPQLSVDNPGRGEPRRRLVEEGPASSEAKG